MDRALAARFYASRSEMCPYCESPNIIYYFNWDDQIAHERNNTRCIKIDWQCDDCKKKWDESYDMNYITASNSEMVHYDDLPPGSLEDWEDVREEE